jgi:hypothetical protein
MADHAHEHHNHGSMDIRDQEKTFAGFVRLSTWTVVVVVCILIFMALANS